MNRLDDLPGQLRPGSLIGTLEVLTGIAITFCFGAAGVGGITGGGLIADGIHRIANDGQTDVEQALRDHQIRNRVHE